MKCVLSMAGLSTEEAGAAIREALGRHKVLQCVEGPQTDIAEFYVATASAAGDLIPMEENLSGNKTGQFFLDVKYPWSEDSPSFAHSNTRQPLHTDGSYEANAPDVTFFCCIAAPDSGGATIFYEGDDLVRVLETHDPALLNRLRTEPVVHHKGNDSKTRPILDDGHLTWNYYRCQDCSLKDDFHEFLERHVVGAELYESVPLKPGEALFFRDEDLLHGRTAFVGHRWLIKGGLRI